MIRVSVTTLEAFRRLIQTEYGSEAELIAQVRGEPFKPSWQMLAGTAWHSVLESPDSHQCFAQNATEADCYFRSGAYVFSEQHVNAALQHIGPGVWEVKATKQIGPALVVAKADHVRGLVLQDNKTKFSTPDARDYEHSLQWRFYLLVHDAPVFRYNLFDFADPKGGYCELRNIVSFKFWSYPGLEADCRRWLNEFLWWAESKNLLGYLDREGSSPVMAA